MDENIERTDKNKENMAAESGAAEQHQSTPGPEDEVKKPEPSEESEAPGAASDQNGTEESSAQNADNGPESEEKSEPEEKSAESAADNKDAEPDDAPILLDAPAEEAKKDHIRMPDAPAPEPPASGAAARLFDALSYAGLPVLLILAAAMTFLEV